MFGVATFKIGIFRVIAESFQSRIDFILQQDKRCYTTYQQPATVPWSTSVRYQSCHRCASAKATKTVRNWATKLKKWEFQREGRC